jgi:SET domain-containing protein
MIQPPLPSPTSASTGVFQVRRSSIHGRGVFAAQPIPEDERIGVYEGKPTEDDGTYVLWVEDGKGGSYGIRGTGPLRFLNHSHEPNAEFDGEELWALRDIAPGEEITFHYGEEWGEEPADQPSAPSER